MFYLLPNVLKISNTAGGKILSLYIFLIKYKIMVLCQIHTEFFVSVNVKIDSLHCLILAMMIRRMKYCNNLIFNDLNLLHLRSTH